MFSLTRNRMYYIYSFVDFQRQARPFFLHVRCVHNSNDKKCFSPSKIDSNFSRVSGVCQQQLKSSNIQEDPCKAKNKVTPDVAYCDRYWECVDGQPELYDCPNGLVYAGKHRGVTEGCDYPWRADYCEGKTQASKYEV